MAAIFKIVKSPRFSEKLSDFDEIQYTTANVEADCSHMTKSFKIQDGGRPPFWKLLYRHISVKNLTISMKFGTQHQILNPITVTWSKIEIFEIRDGDGRHLENHFLAITHRPVVWFQRNSVWASRMACRQGLDDKNCQFLKSKIADGRHFENR